MQLQLFKNKHWANKPSILVIGDSPCGNTGLGRVTREAARAIWESGEYNLVVIGVFHPTAQYIPTQDVRSLLYYQSDLGYDIVPILPTKDDPFASELFKRVFDIYMPDVVLSIGDSWMYDYIGGLRKNNNFTWCAYTAIDTEKIAAKYKPTYDMIDFIFLYCSFAAKSMHNLDQYCYSKSSILEHGVDTELFRPLDAMKKRRLKTQMGLKESDFLFISTDRNQPRKRIDKLMLSFKKFQSLKCICAKCEWHVFNKGICEKCGSTTTQPFKADNAYLYIHGAARGDVGGDLIAIMEKNSIKNLLFNPKHMLAEGVPDSRMAELYNTGDVYLSVTTGEGHGLCLHEALACGLPVVAPNYSAYVDLLITHEKEGYLAKVADKFIDNGIECVRAVVDEDDFIHGMIQLFLHKEKRLGMSASATKKASQYTWERFRGKLIDSLGKISGLKKWGYPALLDRKKPRVISYTPHMFSPKTEQDEKYIRLCSDVNKEYDLLALMQTDTGTTTRTFANMTVIVDTFSNRLYTQHVAGDNMFLRICEQVRPEIIIGFDEAANGAFDAAQKIWAKFVGVATKNSKEPVISPRSFGGIGSVVFGYEDKKQTSVFDNVKQYNAFVSTINYSFDGVNAELIRVPGLNGQPNKSGDKKILFYIRDDKDYMEMAETILGLHSAGYNVWVGLPLEYKCSDRLQGVPHVYSSNNRGIWYEASIAFVIPDNEDSLFITDCLENNIPVFQFGGQQNVWELVERALYCKTEAKETVIEGRFLSQILKEI